MSKIYCPICKAVGKETELFWNKILKIKHCCHNWWEIAYYFAKEGAMKKGDFVDYTGELSGLTAAKNCQIKDLHGPNSVFNQQMALITRVPGWVAVAELVKSETPYIIVVHKETHRAFSMHRNYGILDPDLGAIIVPTEFVEEWDGWLTFDVPDWVGRMGKVKEIQDQFHAYWLF